MDTPIGNTGFGGGTTPTSSGGTGSMASTSSGYCPTCGQSRAGSKGLDQFLGRLGISDEMITNLKTSFQNVDVDEYLNTAREYLKGGSEKATTYVKENPGKVAAGVAVLAVGTGLLINALNKD